MMAAVSACQRNHPLGPMDTRMNDDEYLEYMDEAIQRSDPKKQVKTDDGEDNPDPVGARSASVEDDETSESSSSSVSIPNEYKRVFKPPTGESSVMLQMHVVLMSPISLRRT